MCRDGESMEQLSKIVPWIEAKANPNFIFACEHPNGTSELDTMLASLLPEESLARLSLPRQAAEMWLMPWGGGMRPAQASSVHAEFGRLIWRLLAPSARLDAAHFAPNSPLRLLANDHRMWMNRIYRIALDRREACFTPTRKEDSDWRPLTELRAELDRQLRPEDRTRYEMRRPLMGGVVWDVHDPEDREAVLREAIDGAGVMESLEPVVALLRKSRAHEDFSATASWVKEDFERAFYKKRAALKVSIVETVDDLPVWSVADNDGYAEVLFRDVLAFLDVKERRLMLALRAGKTASQIARDADLRGHASVSRRIAALKKKIGALLH